MRFGGLKYGKTCSASLAIIISIFGVIFYHCSPIGKISRIQQNIFACWVGEFDFLESNQLPALVHSSAGYNLLPATCVNWEQPTAAHVQSDE
jgi:hypothetical protein